MLLSFICALKIWVFLEIENFLHEIDLAAPIALCQGWGLTGYNKRAGSPLRSLKLPVTKVLSYKWITYRLNLYLSSALCQVDDLWLYTESETDGVIKDTCKGDSGGPLIIDNGGQPLLVGVLKVRLSAHTMNTGL